MIFTVSRFFVTLFSLSFFFLSAVEVSASMPLISHWTLDEASGIRNDSVGTNHLTAVNDPGSVVGQVDNANSFTVAGSSYLTGADSASLSTTGGHSFKITLWVKLIAKTGTQVFVSKYDPSGQGEYAVYYEHSFRRFMFSTYAGGSGNHYIAANALGEPALDTWYQIEVEHNGQTATNRITVNGTYTNTLTGVPSHQDTAAPIRIGAFGSTPTYFANAVIDDVKFYKSDPVAVPDGLLAYWKFDEGSGSTALDWAGGTKNGTIIGGATYSSANVAPVEFTNPYSLDFDGSNDGVNTPLSLNNSASFTLAGWAYPRSATNTAGWFGANNVFEFFFSGSNSLKCWTPHGEVDWTFNPVTFLNNWHHITCLGTGTSVILYIDGEQVDQAAHLFTANYGSGDNFSIGIGVQNGGTSGPFDGFIDDVRVYNRALSPAEMYSLGTGAEEPTENPIVTMYTPVHSATSISTSPTLSMVFSTASVEASTGNIGIYKTAGNELVTEIPVTDDSVVKSGATISFTLPEALEEGTSYYVVVPGTGFEDGSGNFFEGVTAGAWSFTTGDFTSPVGSDFTVTPGANSVTATWTTNELASSRVSFGLVSVSENNTSVFNTTPRVLSHEVVVSDLVACTQYAIRVTSEDAFGNTFVSSTHTVTTLGCDYTASSVSTESEEITVASGGSTSLETDDKTFTVAFPAGVTSDGSSFYIQIKELPSSSVLSSIGRPSSVTEVGVAVFDVTAIVDGDTVLDSFDAPVTISYEYTDEEIDGLDEATLTLYHYSAGEWSALSDCVTDTEANTISCTTESFSVFALFGTALPATPTPVVNNGAVVLSYGCNDPIAKNYTAGSAHNNALCVYEVKTATVEKATLPVRDLKFGMKGEDVRALQKLLNANGYVLAKSGAGSPGNETIVFAGATQRALVRYQKDNGVRPAVGYFGVLTRANMSAKSILGVYW